MYFFITTTPFREWHNRPAFTLFSVLPLTSDFSDFFYYTAYFDKSQSHFFSLYNRFKICYNEFATIYLYLIIAINSVYGFEKNA